MNSDDVEKQLRAAKFSHLTEEELNSYHDQKLDTVGQARADAHLKLCLICEHRLGLLKESAASDNREITAEDVELVRRVMQRVGLQRQPSDSKQAEATTIIPLRDRLNDYFRQIAESWQAHFMRQGAGRGTRDGGEKVWQWQIEEVDLKAHATMEKNVGLIIHFSSSDLSLEGVRLNVRLGSVNREATLQRVSETEVYAKVEIPGRQLRKALVDMSIERIS